MNEMPVLPILLGAGAVAGLLLYAHRFAKGVWPFSPTASTAAGQGCEVPEFCHACGAPERRRAIRLRTKVAEIHDALSCGMLTPEQAENCLRFLGMADDVIDRIQGSVKP